MVTVEPRTVTPDVAACLKRIEAEYRDWPALRLTRAQIQRLWGLEPSMSRVVIDTLVATHVLHCTVAGHYVAYGTDDDPIWCGR